jgi:DNA mismatch repair ATPase MutS
MGNNQLKEAYGHYKGLYPQDVLLFRVGGCFEAHFEDAQQIKKSINHPTNVRDGTVEGSVSLPADGILDYVATLHEAGVSCKMISWRNSAGEYAIPDTRTFEEDAKMDY